MDKLFINMMVDEMNKCLIEGSKKNLLKAFRYSNVLGKRGIIVITDEEQVKWKYDRNAIDRAIDILGDDIK